MLDNNVDDVPDQWVTAKDVGNWQHVKAIRVGFVLATLLWRYLPASWRQRAARLHPALAPVAKGSSCGGCSACEGDSCAPKKS